MSFQNGVQRYNQEQWSRHVQPHGFQKYSNSRSYHSGYSGSSLPRPHRRDHSQRTRVRKDIKYPVNHENLNHKRGGVESREGLRYRKEQLDHRSSSKYRQPISLSKVNEIVSEKSYFPRSRQRRHAVDGFPKPSRSHFQNRAMKPNDFEYNPSVDVLPRKQKSSSRKVRMSALAAPFDPSVKKYPSREVEANEPLTKYFEQQKKKI